MPSTVEQLLVAAEPRHEGDFHWDEPAPETSTGVYLSGRAREQGELGILRLQREKLA